MGLWALLPGRAWAAYSPETEAALEILRDRVSAGLAGQESYDAFLDLLAEGAGDGCEAWADLPEAREAESRWSEIRSAMEAVCPETLSSGADGEDSTSQVTQAGPRTGRAPAARLTAAQTFRPRQNPGARNPAPLLRAEGSLPGLSGRMSLRDYRPDSRYLRLGSRGVTFHAGHLHSAFTDTRLGFVAGSRFYAGWSGSSGTDGVLFSPQAALDGLGLRVRAGGWTLEAEGAWNRLAHGSAAADTARRDALLYVAGLERRPGGGSGGLDFRFQAARQRFEPATGPPTEVTVAGAALGNQGEDRNLWRLGLAASLAQPPFPPSREDPAGGEATAGGYLEASLASPHADPESWRLQAHQADAGWANPLQSPRGYLRDTLDGQWILPGLGEGGLSARSRFPLASGGSYGAELRTGGAAGWSLDQGFLAGEGSLALIQTLGEWTHEAGTTMVYRRPGLSGSAGNMGNGGWGQSLSWRRGLWRVNAAFTWKGAGYSGSRPAPLNLTWERTGMAPFAAEILTGDVGNPGSYLRLDVRQGWRLESRVKVEQTLRLPWTPEGMASDMGYQLRLETTL
ncbi:MAG: hypothetical protein JWO30_3993 [Fibrobacteres bacterium]|nr:hypothetical protein [Fibrobacterota bacterium]